MPRYKTKIKMWLDVCVDAEDANAAGGKAMRAMLDVDFRDALKKATPEGAHLQVSYGSVESTTEAMVWDYKQVENPAERLFKIFSNCFKHNGPRVPMSKEMFDDAAAAFAAIPDGPEKLKASAHFSDYDVTLGEIAWPKAVFSGEWLGYENVSSTAAGPHTFAIGFRGYDSGHRWNGWACPEVTLETVQALVAWQDKLSAGQKEGMGFIKIVERDGKLPYLEVSDPCDDTSVTVVEYRRVNTVDGDQILYDIGLGWCWELVGQEDLVREVVG